MPQYKSYHVSRSILELVDITVVPHHTLVTIAVASFPGRVGFAVQPEMAGHDFGLQLIGEGLSFIIICI